MKLSRRSILAALGIGTVAGPAALPAFGRAVLPGALASAGSILGQGSAENYIDYSGQSIGPSVGRFTKPDILKLIGVEWEKRQDEAQERIYAHERNSQFTYELPSWSPAFRSYNRRVAYEMRQRELWSIREKIDDLVRNWWKENGSDEGAAEVPQSYRDRLSKNVGGGSRSRS